MMCDTLFHDFPRLAKESGFYFYYRTKRIDWSEIDELDVDDIIKNKRFEKLEDKLEFVINCELDDDVTRVLDCNFVKLFRLAQLSVSYLRHCQFYLDRCVILLQEQLTTALKKVENSRDSISAQNPFKCKECEKSFMSASYLESHQRRRHKSRAELKLAAVAIQTDEVKVEVAVKRSSEQQTEEQRRISTESQTSEVFTRDVGVMTDDTFSTEKSEVMERLENLYMRMEVIEEQAKSSTRENNKEAEHFDFRNILQRMLPMLQQYTPLPTAYVEEPSKAEENQPPLIDLRSEKNNTKSQAIGEMEGKQTAFIVNDISHNEISNSLQDYSDKVMKNIDSPFPESIPIEPTTRIRRKVNLTLNDNRPVPQPRPRKSTLLKQTSLLLDLDDSDSSVEPQLEKPLRTKSTFSSSDSDITNAKKFEIFNDNDVEKKIEISTPNMTVSDESAREKVDEETKRIDMFTIKEANKVEERQKSVIQKFVKKNSPKLKGLRKTIRKSWSSFSDSKLFHSDNLTKNLITGENKWDQPKQDDKKSHKEEAILLSQDGNKKIIFEKKLRELGVDPEWTGIPENSYTRVKSILDRQRQLMEKKNPSYLRRRNDLESEIMKRIQGTENKETVEIKKEPIILAPEETKMYDIENDSDSDENFPIYEQPRMKMHDLLNSSINSSTFNELPTSMQALAAHPSKIESSSVVEIQAGLPASDSSDSTETNAENPTQPLGKLKSSILNKSKEEIKKRVVFADNFEIETSHDLLNIEVPTVPSSNSSTGSSDWDIPMP